MRFTLAYTKTGTADDAVPSMLDGATPSHVDVPKATTQGSPEPATSGILVLPVFKNAASPVAEATGCTAALWVYVGINVPALGTQWVPFAGPFPVSNRKILAIPLHGLAAALPVRFRLTGITGAPATTELMVSPAAGMSAEQLAYYQAGRPVLGDGASGRPMLNQRGDAAVQEQYIPAAEDNANGLFWGQERALADSLGAWTYATSGLTKVGAAGVLVRAGGGRVRLLGGANTHATATYYLLLVNKATAPVANDLPIAPPIALAPNPAATFGQSAVMAAFPGGTYCSLGISYAVSTTPEKVTFPATSDCMVGWAIG